jgi:hypothetical protein
VSEGINTPHTPSARGLLPIFWVEQLHKPFKSSLTPSLPFLRDFIDGLKSECCKRRNPC